MRGLFLTLVTAIGCAASALADGDATCGMGDNAPCAPTVSACEGVMCTDSVYVSNNPDPAWNQDSGGGELAQIHVAQLASQGVGGGICPRCGAGGDNFTCFNGSTPNTLYSNDLDGATFASNTVTLPADGTYDVEYCVIINSNVLYKAAAAVQLVSGGSTTYHYGASIDRNGEGNRELCGRNRLTAQAGATVRLGYFREQTIQGSGDNECKGRPRNIAGIQEKYDWMTVTRVR